MSIKEILKIYLECAASRKIVIFIYTWPALICFLIASRLNVSLIETLLLVSAVSLIGYAVYFYNDLKDFEDDVRAAKLGNSIKSLKPLSQGRISRDLLTKFAVFSAALGLIFASLLNIGVLVSLSLYLVLGVLYSTEPFRFKKRFILKQVITALGAFLAVFAGALAGGQISSVVIFMFLMNFAITMFGNPIMDIPDLLGDKVIGIKTIPIAIGPSMTVRLAIAMFVGLAGGAIIGYLNLGFSIALPVLMILIAGAEIYTLMPLIRHHNDIAFTNIVLRRAIPLFLLMQLIPLASILS